MTIKVLGSSSKGNSYIVKSENGKFILLDVGVNYNTITLDSEFTTFKDLDFVFVSHEHSDHNRSLKAFEDIGVDTITYKNIEPNKLISIGQWKIYPFKVIHNVENYGVIIHDTFENKKLVYATDFSKMPNIKGVDNWLYEINFDEETRIKNATRKETKNMTHLQNAYLHHNSLENAVEYFEKNGRVKNLIICHLSRGNANLGRIIDNISAFSDNVYVAKKGQKYII